MSFPGSIWLSMWCAGARKSEADFAAVRDCGAVDGVEIWTEHPEALWEVEMGAKHGLQVGIHLPFHDLNPVSADAVVAARALERNRQWLHDLAAHGGVHAVLHGGYVADAADRDSVLPRLVEVASTLHTEAAELGIELMLENLIPDKLGYTHIMASNLPEWQNLIAEIGCGAVLDTGHSAASGIALSDVFDTLGHSVRAIHLSDNDEQSDLHLLPGDGHDVTAGLPTILRDLGYTGVITYEISPLRYTLDDVLNHIVAEAAR
jgi:sugar phosphate isomerase/epimerase